MRHEDKLKEKVGTRMPYAVPEGYFKSFKTNIMDSLPEYPEKPRRESLSVWQRMKPYVYLAAMFAGIWCMMQIFHRAGGIQPLMQDTMSQMAAVYEPETYDLYLSDSTGADLELEDEVISLYPSMDDFEKDFYAQL